MGYLLKIEIVLHRFMAQLVLFYQTGYPPSSNSAMNQSRSDLDLLATLIVYCFQYCI